MTSTDVGHHPAPAQTRADGETRNDLRLYVYYRLHAHIDEASAFEAIRNMQFELVRQHRVRAELLKRRDDALTWMEIYEQFESVDDFERALADAVRRHRLEALLAHGSNRHIERFVSLTGPSFDNPQ